MNSHFNHSSPVAALPMEPNRPTLRLIANPRNCGLGGSLDAPRHLSARTTALWKETTTMFTLERTEYELLRLACEALDRAEQARVILAEEGLTSRGRYGQTLAHPAVAIERDARLAAARLIKQLGLPEAPAEVVSPLALRRRSAG
jgi:P27 family predicted phage terminase small subunit